MLQNHTIARIAGFPIRANLALGYMLALWFVWGAANGMAGFTALLIVLSTLLLLAHELGHAFMAKRFGLDVIDIVLWPLGGMARISNMPEDARTEGWIAAAGPLVNLGLAAAAAPLLAFVNAGPGARSLRGTDILVGENAHGVIVLFIVINLAYGLFNLLPAFPMDGGRLLRAFYARGGRSWVAATERATKVGGVIAWAMIFLAIIKGAFLLTLVGFFVLWAGLRERWSTRLKHHAESMAEGSGRMAGWDFLMRQRAGGAAGAEGGARFGDEVPRPDPVPGAGPGPTAPPGSGKGHGFSDEDIERLESFRGRIQKPDRSADAAQ